MGGCSAIFPDLRYWPRRAPLSTAASKPLKTHAWMIAAQGDLAVAVFVNDGKSGSSTAGPLLRTFLAKAR